MKNSINFNEILTRLGYSAQFKVDKYQRFYKWTKKQCERLFNDILEWSTKQHDTKDYFIQSIAIFWEMVDKLVQVVDGQQRITSMSLMFLAYRNVILETNSLYRDQAYQGIANNILYNHTVPNSTNNIDGVTEYRIVLQENDNNLYRAVLERNNDVIGAAENKDKNVIAAYKYFHNALKTLLNKDEKKFQNFYYNGLLKVSTLIEECETQAEANLCFIKKNGTGLYVEKGEVCIAMLYDALDKLDNKAYLENAIDESISMLQMIQNFYTGKDELNWFVARFIYHFTDAYDVTREDSLPNELEKLINENNIIDLIREITKYHKLEQDAIVLNPKIPFSLFRELYLVWGDLMRLNVPLKEAQEILHLVDGLEVRKSIKVGSSGNADKSFAGLIKKSIAMTGTSSLKESIIKYVNIKRMTDTVYYKFPSNDELYGIIFDKKYYTKNNVKIKDLTKHILECVNDFLCNGENQMLSKYDGLEIEHIMPQSNKASNPTMINSIGNLTLLDASWNKKASNKDFAEKKEQYSNSVIKLNRYFDNIYEWDESAIEKRAYYICDCINKMWNLDYEISSEELRNFEDKDVLARSKEIIANLKKTNNAEREFEFALAIN